MFLLNSSLAQLQLEPSFGDKTSDNQAQVVKVWDQEILTSLLTPSSYQSRCLEKANKAEYKRKPDAVQGKRSISTRRKAADPLPST